MLYFTWTFLVQLCCISSIHGEESSINEELDLVRNERFLLDDVNFHDPQAYVSTGSLTFKNRIFYLDGKEFRILSGSIHYFRVPEYYWKDRLLKMKAGGLNTAQIYVPWNLHEETPGKFSFDGILNVRKFIQMAHSLGMYVIFRPGPYICGEWDLGGLPSWLLKDRNMQLRSNYPGYTSRVQFYFRRLLREIVDLQHKRGGPIIAVQIENEFGSFSDDLKHLLFLKKELQANGIEEMFFTSDGFYNNEDNGMDRAPFYKEALPTANFDKLSQGVSLFRKIANLSQDFPLMVTEYWAGWFDQWGGQHHATSLQDHETTVSAILNTGASINFYMYHGGTNFGFTSGANWVLDTSTYVSDVTSYDYDAPLNEAGDLTLKFKSTRALIQSLVLNHTSLPDPPPNGFKAQYGTVSVTEFLPLESLIILTNREIHSYHPKPMEDFDQSFGYILYRTQIPHGKNLSFSEKPSDRIQVFVNGMSAGLLESWKRDRTINMSATSSAPSQGKLTLDILVENRGRVNYEKLGWNIMSHQRKGINNDVLLDNQPLLGWKIYPLDFSRDYLSRVSVSSFWRPVHGGQWTTPAMFRAYLKIDHTPHDTFLLMTGWIKGFVAINGHNLGRYWEIGPQRTLYVPAPFLKQGINEILVFEQHYGDMSLVFQSMPSL